MVLVHEKKFVCPGCQPLSEVDLGESGEHGTEGRADFAIASYLQKNIRRHLPETCPGVD